MTAGDATIIADGWRMIAGLLVAPGVRLPNSGSRIRAAARGVSGRALFLGVDGGGTKTAFVCLDGDGREVARAATGTTYHLQVGLAGAVSALEAGVGAICAALAIGPEAFTYAFFGLPAYGEDREMDPRLQAACGRILGNDRFLCGNDMVCGWAGSLAGEDGINLVAGTGSIGYGERAGRSARAGGWGEVFGDEGSAYWIAVQGLNAFSRMSDGRLPRGPLHERFRAALELDDDLDLCARVSGERGMARDAIAGRAPLVGEAVAIGDPVATAIHERAAAELAAIAGALRASLGFPDDEAASLSWSGGVLANDAGLRARLAERLAAGGRFRLVQPAFPADRGAALYAMRRSVHLTMRG